MQEKNFEPKPLEVETSKEAMEDSGQIDLPLLILEGLKEEIDRVNKETKKQHLIEAGERNFEIKLGEEETGVSLKLKRSDNGEELDLADCLPQGYKFQTAEVFACSHRAKRIEFPKDELTRRGFLLSLFHEIGHANEGGSPPVRQLKKVLTFGYSLLKMIRAIELTTEETPTGKKMVLQLKRLTVDDLIPQWFIRESEVAKVASERKAWAYSLWTLRRLEADGYEVLAGFNNLAEVKSMIHHCLPTYDVTRFQETLASTNLERVRGFDKLPRFTRRSKRKVNIKFGDEIK